MPPEKDSSSLKTASFLANIGQTFWTVIVGAGVFFATLYSTQSVVNTKIDYLQNEINNLKNADTKMESEFKDLSQRQNALLLDISSRIRDMEVSLRELQVKISFAIGEDQGKTIKSLPSSK